MKKNITNILSVGLIFILFLIINSNSYINMYSVDKMSIGPSVIVAGETNVPSADILVTVERYMKGEWVKICDLAPDSSGKAILELQEDELGGSFYRFSLSINPESIVYAYVSESGEISYSKHFNVHTCSLGDGANFKIRTVRIN